MNYEKIKKAFPYVLIGLLLLLLFYLLFCFKVIRFENNPSPKDCPSRAELALPYFSEDIKFTSEICRIAIEGFEEEDIDLKELEELSKKMDNAKSIFDIPWRGWVYIDKGMDLFQGMGPKLAALTSDSETNTNFSTALADVCNQIGSRTVLGHTWQVIINNSETVALFEGLFKRVDTAGDEWNADIKNRIINVEINTNCRKGRLSKQEMKELLILIGKSIFDNLENEFGEETISKYIDVDDIEQEYEKAFVEFGLQDVEVDGYEEQEKQDETLLTFQLMVVVPDKNTKPLTLRDKSGKDLKLKKLQMGEIVEKVEPNDSKVPNTTKIRYEGEYYYIKNPGGRSLKPKQLPYEYFFAIGFALFVLVTWVYHRDFKK